MNKRHPAVCRRTKACPVRVEILEDRYLPAGFASSTLLPTPDSVTRVEDLAKPATGAVLDLVSQGTGAVLEPVSQSAAPVLKPVSQSAGAVLEPVRQGTAPVLEPVSQSAGAVLKPVSQSAAPVLKPVSQSAGAVLKPVSQGTAPVLEPVSQSAGAVLEPVRQSAGAVLTPVSLITTQVGRRSLPEDGAALGLDAVMATWDGADSQALLLGLPGLSDAADTALRQDSVFAWREAIWAKLETSIEARGETEPTRSGSGAAGEDGVVPAAGRASTQEGSAEELAGDSTGTREQERLLPPKAPLRLNDLLGPASGVIDEFFPLGPAAWKQATERFVADVADLVKEGSNLAPWLTALALLGAAYEIARRDLRRLQAQQVLDSTQLPDLSGLMPPGEP
jgi:hypothetical protein